MSFWGRVRSRLIRKGASEVDTRGAADSESPDQEETIAGERGVASISRSGSIQSRVSNVLAIGLMSVLALGFLAWYYTQTFARQKSAAEARALVANKQPQSEMSLPPLGRVDPPVVEQVLGPPPERPTVEGSFSNRFQPDVQSGYPPQAVYGVASSPEQQATERRLAGPVFVGTQSDSSPGGSPQNPSMYMSSGGMNAASQPPGTTTLSGLLQPTATPSALATVLPTQRLLLPKGAFLDCTLETAIDSSLPGMTTCVTATDTFSADGNVVLMERGTKLVGETQGDMKQGTARVFVLWTEARTPDGVVVPLASPGADELGRSGLPGIVNRHFWERFGAAILVSTIDGAVQAAAQQSRGGEGAVVVNPSTSHDVMTEVLRSTINIPPTVTKQQGDRIAVLVARDLDFRSVYELRSVAVRR